MIPKAAIEKAIEGGFVTSFDLNILGTDRHPHLERACECAIALAPSFWQALGKALGWDYCPLRHVEHTWQCQHWMKQALTFYDLILTGGDTQTFWNDLLA